MGGKKEYSAKKKKTFVWVGKQLMAMGHATYPAPSVRESPIVDTRSIVASQLAQLALFNLILVKRFFYYYYYCYMEVEHWI